MKTPRLPSGFMGYVDSSAILELLRKAPVRKPLVLADLLPEPMPAERGASLGWQLRDPATRTILREPQADGSWLVLLPGEGEVRHFGSEAGADFCIREFRATRTAWHEVRDLPGEMVTAAHPWRGGGR